MIDSKDDWVTAKVIVQRINGGSAKNTSDQYFVQHIASKPGFPRPSKFGKTRVWNWREVSDYLRAERERL